MTLDLTTGTIAYALLIFVLRVVNYAISTMRLVFIARNMKVRAAITAFFEALIFAVVIAGVVSDLQNVINLTAYCLGAAVGSYVGMWLEGRFIVSYTTVTIITREKGQAIANLLREHGYGVTLTRGEGRDGPVDVLRSSTISRDVPHMNDLIKKLNPDAFIETESARSLTRGWIPGGPPRRMKA